MIRRLIPPKIGIPMPPRAVARAPAPRPPRVCVDGVVEIRSGNGHNPRFRLHDLSLCGFSFESGSDLSGRTSNLRGSLEIVVDGIAVTLFMLFEVAGHDRVKGRVHCRFVNPGTQELSVLRYLVATRLAGRPAQAAEFLRLRQSA